MPERRRNDDNGPRLTNPDLKRTESNLLYLLLLRTDQYSFLPELFEAVNEDTDAMAKLLHCFAGVTIAFPSINQLEKMIEEVRIFLRMRYARRRQETRDSICAEYSIHDATIDVVCKRMNKLVKEAGIKV